MPKSKRARPVLINKTLKKTKYNKSQLIDRIHTYIDTYKYVFIFQCINMRNNSLKQLRTQLTENTKFVLGKSSIIKLALGLDSASEYSNNLSQLTKYIHGSCGLLFTNDSIDNIIQQFKTYSVPNYCRSGNVCIDTFMLPQGELPSDIITFSMELQLRKLGLPTQLKNGVVSLLSDVTVCSAGDILTPEQCKILELFQQKQAVFKIQLIAVYDNGAVIELEHSENIQENETDMNSEDIEQ